MQEDPNTDFAYVRGNSYDEAVGAPTPPTLLWAGTAEGEAALYGIEQRRADEHAAVGSASGGEWWSAEHVVAEPGEHRA